MQTSQVDILAELLELCPLLDKLLAGFHEGIEVGAQGLDLIASRLLRVQDLHLSLLGSVPAHHLDKVVPCLLNIDYLGLQVGQRVLVLVEVVRDVIVVAVQDAHRVVGKVSEQVGNETEHRRYLILIRLPFACESLTVKFELLGEFLQILARRLQDLLALPLELLD